MENIKFYSSEYFRQIKLIIQQLQEAEMSSHHIHFNSITRIENVIHIMLNMNAPE